MKHLVFPFLILLSGFIFYSCETDGTPQDYDQQVVQYQPLTIQLDSFVKRGGGPCTADTNCMEVNVVWPVLAGGKPSITDSINQSIYLAVIANLEYNPEAVSPSIEAAADSLIDMYRQAYEGLDHWGMGYSMSVDGNMTIRDSIGVLELNNYYFMGGAHGNYGTLYYNFDLRNGQVIEYDHFVSDTSAFKSTTKVQLADYISNEPMYKQHGLQITDLFWGDEFFLPANYKLAKDSIEFIYNPYEAAPYAVGQIFFSVPYTAYGQSLKRRF